MLPYAWLVTEDGQRWELSPYHRASWEMFLTFPIVCAPQRAQATEIDRVQRTDLQLGLV
ncbi:hypothetical protein P3T43_002700 [Paraburkholderia sp. GAS41]|jgi:hypothetical protein|uniref:hypothetical protein n=1 Tax=Paraburkholderia sp. GAS41 TaxID=3035134 RepID=UPI003D255332